MPEPRPISQRLPWFILSFFMVGFGIALVVSAHLGVGPGDVVNTGGSKKFGIGVGTMGWILGSTWCLIAILLKRRPQVGTFVGMIGVGQIVNWSLQILPEPEPIVWRIIMYVSSLAILYVAIALGVATNLGTGPIELAMLGMADRGMSVQLARWLIEALILVAGILLGGQVGIGTVIFVVVTGPALSRLMPPIARYMGTEHLMGIAPTELDF